MSTSSPTAAAAATPPHPPPPPPPLESRDGGGSDADSNHILCFADIDYAQHRRHGGGGGGGKDDDSNHHHVHADTQTLLDLYVLDKYYPRPTTTMPTTTRVPIVVYMHGGAWIIGDKDQHNSRQVCLHFAEHDCVAVSVSYSLTSLSNRFLTSTFLFVTSVLFLLAIVSTFDEKATLMCVWIILSFLIVLVVIQRHENHCQHPCHVRDCAAAIRWARDHGAEFGGDPQCIILVGHSAGAHLTALLSCNPMYLAEVGLQPSDMAGAVCISGVYNDNGLRAGGSLASNLLYEAFGDQRTDHVQAFPIHHVEPHRCPPFLLVSAQRDYSLKRQAREFLSTCRLNQVYCDARLYPGTNHYSIILGWDRENWRVLRDIIHFIKRATEARRRHNTTP